MNWNEKYIEDWSNRWDYAMKHTDNFSAEIRSKAAVDHHAEKDVCSYDESMGKDTQRVEKTIHMLEQRNFLQEHWTALDVGSGTGIFTLPLAKRLKSVTSLDISEGMQDIIRRKAQAEQITNIEYLSQNWKTVDIVKEGLFKQYDLVLSSLNTRGICDYETLNKMNQASRKACCLLAFTGGGTKNHRYNLNELILGRQLETAGGNDIIMPFNLIYHMGGRPELSYADICWDKAMAAEQATESICFDFWRFAKIDADMKEKIRTYVYTHLEKDGKYHEIATVPVGIMVWDAERIQKMV